MRDRTLIAVAALSLTYFLSAQAPVVGSNSNAGDNNERHGTMQLVKSCQNYQGLAGNWCAITQSNLDEIPINTDPSSTTVDGTVNYYTQAFGIIPNLVESNVILDAGNGNRAIGRCTFAVTTNTGVCNYNDGTGTLAGFSARLEVTLDDGSVPSYFLTGPYVFKNVKKPAS